MQLCVPGLTYRATNMWVVAQLLTLLYLGSVAEV